MDVCYLNTSILKYDATLPDPSFGCDALILDLEDSVHKNQKDAARNLLLTVDITTVNSDISVGIRMNQLHTIDGIKDLSMIYHVIEKRGIKIDFIQIPKVREAYDVIFCREVLRNLPYRVKIIPIIETPQAINEIENIAKQSDAMMFGQVDMAASMYKINTAYLNYSRGRFCVACFNESIPAIDTAVFTNEADIKDKNAFEKKCIDSRMEGFTAKAVVHPTQIPIVKNILGIDQNELQKSQSIIDKYNSAKDGFSIVDGAIVAPPFVAHAESVLKLYHESN